MPSLGDSALIFFLALLLFGPKKLPELARQLGKLMGEFRRASNEFRMQMEEELRVSEQDERQKKIAAIEAAAPVAPSAVPSITDDAGMVMSNAAAGSIAPPVYVAIADPLDTHPHMIPSDAPLSPAPVPIATSGNLNLMPPLTGLPVGRAAATPAFTPASSDLTPMLDAIPHEPEPPARHTGSLATEATSQVQSEIQTEANIEARSEVQLHG